jgi:hypothetical protein
MALKLAAVMILLLAIALGAGCAAPGESGGSQATPGQATPAQGGTQSRPQGDISPGPVVTVPPDYFVDIQVDKNMIFTKPDIRVRFAGGKGMYIIRRMFVEVYKSDGTYETGVIEHLAGEFRMGETVTIRGTTGTDRVIVTVTILGKDYKIYDQYLEFKTRP